MSTTDHTKAAGKPARRARKAMPQGRKPERKPVQAKAAKARAGASVVSDHVDSNGSAAPVPATVAAARRVLPALDAAPVSLQTIATAYGESTKRSLEEVRSFAEKLTEARSLDKAIAIQSEFAQHAFQNLLADTQKIYGLYGELAKQTLRPFGGLMANAAQAAR
jgi:hypothetical protein